MMNTADFRQRYGQAGFSLVELMVAITIGLIVLMALSGLFLSSNRASVEMRKSTQQQESGRYASQLLSDDLMMAGYLAEFDSSPLTTPAEPLPDSCEKDIADLLTALPLHVQGVNDAAVIPSCLTDEDVKAGTDIIVVRRASTCVAGVGECAAFVGGVPHFQASLCTPTDGSGAELAHAINNDADYAAHHFTLSGTATDFIKRKTSCGATDLAAIQRYLVHIYFIANNNEASDGIPTLKLAKLGAGGFTVRAMVDGIENMQIAYGIDNNNDGIPDTYDSAPATNIDWRNVMSARIHLLARNTVATPGFTDSRSYTLGDKVVAAPGDGYKRHVYSTTVQFVNPSWRRQ
jgi:type IV pilus assembly protein PilW